MAHPPGSSSSSSPAGFDFAAFRSVRFGSGLACPRCQSRRVHRWGFSGRRRRYHCLGCGRTFSDFTGTPLAYLKRIDQVPDYLRCLERAWPVRGTALLLGLDPCTAFRWRHRFLAHRRDTDGTTLLGDVGLGLLRFPYSEKGRRHAPPGDRAAPQGARPRDRWERTGDPGKALPPRSVPPRSVPPVKMLPAVRMLPAARVLPRVLVLVAWERDGPIASGVVGCGVAEPDRVDRLLRRCLARPVRIATVEGPYGPLRRWARGAGAPVQVVPSPELEPIGTYGRYLRRWLRRFRGVATRYLDHYLTWFALKDPAQWGVQDSRPAPLGGARRSRRAVPNDGSAESPSRSRTMAPRSRRPGHREGELGGRATGTDRERGSGRPPTSCTELRRMGAIMTKRPDQHSIDPNEAGATDYKSRRQTEDQNRQDSPDSLESNPQVTGTPKEAMESRRRQSRSDREDEVERARQAQERNEGRRQGGGNGS